MCKITNHFNIHELSAFESSFKQIKMNLYQETNARERKTTRTFRTSRYKEKINVKYLHTNELCRTVRIKMQFDIEFAIENKSQFCEQYTISKSMHSFRY